MTISVCQRPSRYGRTALFQRIIVALSVACFACTPLSFAQSKGKIPQMLQEGPNPSFAYSEQDLAKIVPPARQEDVTSPEAIVSAMHEALSGPQGTWSSARFCSLMLPKALFVSGGEMRDGSTGVEVFTLNDFLLSVVKLHRETAWYERVVSSTTATYIPRKDGVVLATVTEQTVQGIAPNFHPKPSEIGSTTTTLMYVGHRWWVLSHTW